MQLSDAIAQYKIDYPYQKIRTKSTPDSISLDDEASCFEQLANLLLPNGIISGLGVAVDGSNNLTVQPGVWQIDRLQYSTATITTFALDAQDPSLSRYDVIYADAFNTLHLLSGDLSSSPVQPAIPDGTLLICTALITPTSVTVNSPPPTDYVDTHSNQMVNGIKTFIQSPQVPNAVNDQDAVAFNQLNGFLKGINFTNGIQNVSGANYGFGGTLTQPTQLDLDGNNLSFTQGFLFQADYTTFFNSFDRAIIDAGYFRKNQWFRPWVSGQNYVTGGMVSNTGQLYFVGTPVSNSTIAPVGSLRPGQFSGAVSDVNNITTYLNWVANPFVPAGDGLLYIEASFTTANNTTFPLFSYSASVFGEDWFGFSVGVDNNNINAGYYAEYKFSTSQVATSGTWYELLPIYKSHDFISRTSRTHELHIDVAKNPSGVYEFRGRHILLSGSAAFQDYSIEISRSKSRQLFGGYTITPSNYWSILNSSINPNTQLANWKGTDTTTIPVIRGVTAGIGPQISYAFQTAGLDNYVSDVSGSFTGLSKINKAFADATYLTSSSLGSYLPLAGGTLTGALNLNGAPTTNLMAATKKYVDDSITNSAVYFGSGTFKPGGPILSDPVGTVNNPYIFGDIVADTITTNSGTSTFNNTTNTNILNFKNAGTTVAAVNIGGAFYGAGIAALTGPNDGRIVMDPTGTVISRNQNDAVVALKVAQLNLSSTGDIVGFYNQYRSIYNISIDGSVKHLGLSKSVSTVAIAHNIVSGLKPSANGDVLVGLAINPIFGKSKIATLTTGSLIGGSAYPTGTFLSNVTGGTGYGAVIQATILSGAVTSVLLIDGGINYTAGDVLNIVITVNGSTVGSGASVPVGTITSYTGLINYSLSVLNGPSLFAASTAAYGALIVPPGAAYTGTTNGTIWFDGTNFKTIVGGAVKTFTLT